LPVRFAQAAAPLRASIRQDAGGLHRVRKRSFLPLCNDQFCDPNSTEHKTGFQWKLKGTQVENLISREERGLNIEYKQLFAFEFDTIDLAQAGLNGCQ